ncbi:MAG: Ku protein, partial [Bordetella sp.]|nr:Ku protein [Bordetella sp.]
PEDRPAGEVIDLTEMLKASLSRGKGKVARPKSGDDDAAVVTPLRGTVKAGAKRAPKSSPKTAPATRTRARG